MALINVNLITKSLLDVSSENLGALLSLSKTPEKEAVITKAALTSLNEIKKNQLGCGYSIKKFLNISLIYGYILTLPIGTLLGAAYGLFSQVNFSNMLYGPIYFAALRLSDLALAKTLGINPMTATLVASYDIYRQSALFLCGQIEKSYTNHEEKIKALIQNREELLRNDLKQTYFDIASELAKRFKQKTLTNEVEILNQKIPVIENAFTNTGLSSTTQAEILQPLKDTIECIEILQKPKTTDVAPAA